MLKGLIAGALLAFPAMAETNCGPRQQVVEYLQGTYGETRQAIGLSGSGLIVEWWQSPQQTFTVVITRPDGLSCMVEGGDNAALLLEPAGEAM